MRVGGGLVVLGTVGIGLVEMTAGSSPVSGEGQLVHETLVPLEIGSYIILLGFVIWGVLAIYTLAAEGRAPGTALPTLGTQRTG